MVTEWLNHSMELRNGQLLAYIILAAGFGMGAGIWLGVWGYKRSESFKFDCAVYHYEKITGRTLGW